MKRFLTLTMVLLVLALAGCGAGTAAPVTSEKTPAPTEIPTESTSVETTEEPIQTGLIAEQILSGAEGDIHYSYYGLVGEAAQEWIGMGMFVLLVLLDYFLSGYLRRT